MCSLFITVCFLFCLGQELLQNAKFLCLCWTVCSPTYAVSTSPPAKFIRGKGCAHNIRHVIWSSHPVVSRTKVNPEGCTQNSYSSRAHETDTKEVLPSFPAWNTNLRATKAFLWSSGNSVRIKQRYKQWVEVWTEAVVKDFLSYQYFQRREDSVAQSLWTCTETRSLQEQALSSELSL